MKKPVRILAFGWYGAGNFGDDLLLEAIVHWAVERGASVEAISIDPTHTTATHGIRGIDFHDLGGIANAMQRADLFVLGGGGLFQTHDPLTIGGLFDFTKGDVALYARPVLMARQLGVPTMLWAQGVGPLDQPEAKAIVRDVFSESDYASVRDDASLALLHDVGVVRDVVVAPDPAWCYPTLERHPPAGGRRVGIVVRAWAGTPGWEERLLAALRIAFPPGDATFVWIPAQAHAVAHRSESDLPLSRSLMARLGDGYTQELVECHATQDLIAALDHCDMIVAMRLHAQIIALRLGKPTCCIEYDEKMAIASSHAGVPDALRVDVAAPGAEWDAALRALAAPGAAPGELRIDQLQQAALAHRDLLLAAIDAAGTKPDTQWRSNGFDWLGTWQQERAHKERTRLQAEIARQQRVVAERDAHVSQLNAHAAHLDAHVSQLSTHVSQLNAHASDLTAHIATLNGQVIQLTGDLTAARTRADEQAQATTELRAIADERAEQIGALQAAQATLQSAHDASVAQAEALDAALIQANTTMARQAEHVLHVEHMLARRQSEQAALLASTSWRITRPMRFVKYFLLSPRDATRRMRHFIGGGGVAPPERRLAPPGDLSWEDFERTVLSRKDKFKGIFVQEIVIDWDVPLYQRPQHIANAMARLGYLVIYRTVNWTNDDVDGFRQVMPNVWLTNRPEVDSLQGVVRSVYSTAYADDPENLKRRQAGSVMVYEYIDHIDPQISGDTANINRLLALRDWAFGGGADVVVASAKMLEREAIDAVGADRVLLVPNGVDTRHYRDQAHADTPLPESLQDFRAKFGTLVGYFGALAPWLWYEVINTLVEMRPDIGFVFIGPDYYGGADRLVTAPNVLYLGAVDYKQLPAHARKFDICFIPFEPGDIARTTSPLKLFEYFALEKPVVVTSEMHECVQYPEVLSADSAEGFSAAIDQAIALKSDPRFRARLAQMADENDWNRRAKVMEMAFAALPSQGA